MLEEKNLYDATMNKLEDVLIVFDNVDRLPKDILRMFERRLIDLIRHNPKLRFLTSSTKKFNFEHFSILKSCTNEDKLKDEAFLKYKMTVLQIKPFTEMETVHLLLSSTQRSCHMVASGESAPMVARLRRLLWATGCQKT